MTCVAGYLQAGQGAALYEHFLPFANGWAVTGGEQHHCDVYQMHHWRPATSLAGLAVVGRILLQYGLPLCSQDHALLGRLQASPTGVGALRTFFSMDEHG